MAFVQEITLHNFQTELNGGDIVITVPFGYSPREYDRILYFHSNFRFIRASFRDADGRGNTWTINGSVFYERYEPQPVVSELSYARTFENTPTIDTIGYTPSTSTNAINGFAGYGWGFGTEDMSLYFFPDSTDNVEQSNPVNPVMAYTDGAATDPEDLVWITLVGAQNGIDTVDAELVPNDVSFPDFERESRMIINVREPDAVAPLPQKITSTFPASRVLTITAVYGKVPTTATITDAVVVDGGTRTPITFGDAVITDKTAVFTSTAIAAGVSGTLEFSIAATNTLGYMATYTATANTIGGNISFVINEQAPATIENQPEDTNKYWWDADEGVLYEGCNTTAEAAFPNGRPYVWRLAHEVIAFVTSEYIRRGSGNTATYHRIDYINPFHTLRLYYQTVDGAGELTEPVPSVLRTYAADPITKESTVSASDAGFLLGRGRFLADNEDAERSLAEAAGSGGGGFGSQFSTTTVGRGSDTLGLTPDAPEQSAPTDNTPTNNNPTDTQDTTTRDAADSVSFGGGNTFGDVGFSSDPFGGGTPTGGQQTTSGGVKTNQRESSVRAEQSVSDILGGISIDNDLSSFAPSSPTDDFDNVGSANAAQKDLARSFAGLLDDGLSNSAIGSVNTDDTGVDAERTQALTELQDRVRTNVDFGSVNTLGERLDAAVAGTNENVVANTGLLAGGVAVAGGAILAGGVAAGGVAGAAVATGDSALALYGTFYGALGVASSGGVGTGLGVGAAGLVGVGVIGNLTESEIRTIDRNERTRQEAAANRNLDYQERYGDQASGLADRNGGGFNPGGGGGRDNDPNTPF